MSSADAAQETRDEQCLILQSMRLQSSCKCHCLVFSDGSHTQTPGCPVQEKPGSDRDRDYGVDQQVLFEKRMSYLWQVCESRYWSVLQAADGFSNVGLADDCRKTESEEHQSQAGRELVSTPRDDEIREDHVERCAGKRCSEHSNVWIAGLGRNNEADDRADEHDTLEPEVHDS